MNSGLRQGLVKWSGIISVIAALFAVVGLSAPIAAASPNPHQKTMVRKLLAHNEVSIPIRHYVDGASGPYTVTYARWSTDLFELCGAGGKQLLRYRRNLPCAQGNAVWGNNLLSYGLPSTI